MTDASLYGKRILIVEDEYFIATDLARVLRGVDAEIVGPVGNVAQAVNLVLTQMVDAAILDVNLEGDFSYSMADLLRKEQVPHAFITGYDDWFMPERYRDTPRLTKPFASTAILNVVAELCRLGSRDDRA